MKIMIWNVRGIGNKATQQQVNFLKNIETLDMLAIIEPMITLDEIGMQRIFKMDKVVANCSNKIWLLSNSSFEVEVLLDHIQCLDCRVTSGLPPQAYSYYVGVRQMH